jgi:hypothetical protein
MLSDEQQKSHFLSNLSYQPPNQRQRYIDESKYSNHFFIDPANNHDTFVSVRAADNKIYNAHRGTSNSADVLTDAYLAAGKLQDTSRYKESSARSKAIYSQYGDQHDIVEVGHSLGGTLADQISREHGGQSVSLNMGASPFASYGKDVSDDHQHIRTDNDLVSHFSSDATQTIQHDRTPFQQAVESTPGKLITAAAEVAAGPAVGIVKIAEAGYNAASSFFGHSLSNFTGH